MSGNLSYQVSEIIVETANEAFELDWTPEQERVLYTKESIIRCGSWPM